MEQEAVPTSGISRDNISRRTRSSTNIRYLQRQHLTWNKKQYQHQVSPETTSHVKQEAVPTSGISRDNISRQTRSSTNIRYLQRQHLTSKRSSTNIRYLQRQHLTSNKKQYQHQVSPETTSHVEQEAVPTLGISRDNNSCGTRSSTNIRYLQRHRLMQRRE